MSTAVPQSARPGIFSLNLPARGRLRRGLVGAMAPGLERVLGLAWIAEFHARRPAGLDGAAFVRWVLDELGVQLEVQPADRARIPLRGPLIVVANHPFGGLEGLALADLLAEVRGDVRILGNHLLARVPELRSLLIPVDPFGGDAARRSNPQALWRALRWLGEGGALLTFPAGEVAHLDWRARAVVDPPWSASIARLARVARAQVLPVHVPGRNGTLFQAAGLVHPLLRTALLPRQFIALRGTRLRARVGTAVVPDQLQGLGGDEQVIRHLRWRTELLAGRDEPRSPTVHRHPEPLAAPVPPELLAAELDGLPPGATLVESREDLVFLAHAHEAPLALQEIGRLREIAFRAAGEGTGRARDLDRFDQRYRHLIGWSRARQEIVGSYRVGAVDELLAGEGVDGLYTSTLFNLDVGLLRELGPALELGRSFVRLERQRSPSGLPLLWRGLGALACREPQRPVLLGAVSISATYGTTARRLLHAFLWCLHRAPGSARRVQPRHPWRDAAPWGAEVAALGNLDELSELVALADPEGKVVPVLVRQYLKLGARVLGFNVDPQFGGVLDALIVVDLRRVDRKVLERFMGREQAARWIEEARATAGETAHD